MDKKVIVSGREMTLRNNALIPRKYRNMFGRDLMFDMKKLHEDYKAGKESISTEVLENVTFLMFKEAKEDVGETVEEFLASIDDLVELYELIGDVVDIWGAGLKTTAKPKKK